MATVTSAIRHADELRPNVISDEHKAAWLHRLDMVVAEHMQEEAPKDTWPVDRELLMPAPHDNIYELYLALMIDFAQQDFKLYSVDQTVYDAALSDAFAWWRRNNTPKVNAGGAKL